jgi:serine/threonine protein kinase
VPEPAYPRTFGAYVLLERLGAGGMSEVDLARKSVGDASFVRFLVIKRIRGGNNVDEQYVRMFQDEARINAELSHENIAQVYDFGREGDEFYMAMEYVPGLDLRAVQLALAKDGKLVPMRVGLTVLCGVLKALQYAHTRVDQLGRPMSIVHRDVNPRNVMVSVNGEVKLIDFGVAKAADRLEKTEGNAIKGKFAYMAPEQIDGQKIDGRVDLYAVGLVLHELLTGRSPFLGLTDVQILHRILSGKIPPLPEKLDHPDDTLLRAVHTRALATRPEDRYRDADAMRADLERALVPLGGPSPAKEIGDLVRETGPDAIADIATRLRAYREDSVPNAARPAPKPPPPPRDLSGTLNVASIDATPEPSLGWLPWLVGLGGGALGIVGLLGLAVAGVWWWIAREPEPEAAPVAEAAPAPVASPPAAPVEAASASPAKEAPRPRTPAPVKAPAEAVPAPAVASPVVASAPPVVSAPPPVVAPAVAAPEPEAAPDPAEFGYLGVVSEPKGLDVYVAGEKKGTTPLRMARVPVGAYEVVVRDPATGRTKSVPATVLRNQTANLTVKLE